MELKNKNDKIININDGINFMLLTERITWISIFDKFLFIASKDNKLIIVNNDNNIPEILFTGSLKKRMEGKGIINQIYVDNIIKKLFVISTTNKLIVYDIIINSNKLNDNNSNDEELNIKIEFCYEIDTTENIKSFFMQNLNLFISFNNKIQTFYLNSKNFCVENDKTNIIPLDGTLNHNLSYSSYFVKIEYPIHISSICYFNDAKLILLGLSNGLMIAISSRSLEVIFAKKISDFSISKIVLLEENFVIIAGDLKGNITFFKFGN